MQRLKGISTLLVVIGALNWGLVGLLKFDLVAAIFGKNSTLSRVVYTLVGLSAAYQVAQVAGHFQEEGFELEIGR